MNTRNNSQSPMNPNAKGGAPTPPWAVKQPQGSPQGFPTVPKAPAAPVEPSAPVSPAAPSAPVSQTAQMPAVNQQVNPLISANPMNSQVLGDPEQPNKRSHTGVVVGIIFAVIIMILLVVGAFLLGKQIGKEPSADQSSVAAATTGSSATTSATTKLPATTSALTTKGTQTSDVTIPSDAVSNLSSDRYILDESDTRYISAQELRNAGLDADSLWLARNEIFARRGRGFNDPELQDYFKYQPWYHESYSPERFDSMSNMLNKYEIANLDTIKEVERSLGSTHL